MNAAHAAQPRCASENGIRARTVQHALAWLSQHVSSAANLHADSRAIQPGDAYLAYAVQGADSRTYIDDAIARGAAAVIWQPSSEHAAPAWTVPNFEASDASKLGTVHAGAACSEDGCQITAAAPRAIASSI